jgi:hypothetical protein
MIRISSPLPSGCDRFTFYTGKYNTVVRSRAPIFTERAGAGQITHEIDYGAFAIANPHFIVPEHKKFWLSFAPKQIGVPFHLNYCS